MNRDCLGGHACTVSHPTVGITVVVLRDEYSGTRSVPPEGHHKVHNKGRHHPYTISGCWLLSTLLLMDRAGAGGDTED